IDIARLYDTLAEPLLRYFARRTLDAEAAADLTAETFAAALSSKDRFRVGANAEAWIYGIAAHQLSHYRRRGSVAAKARRRIGIPDLVLEPRDYERIEELI